jgi:hypothetical protein
VVGVVKLAQRLAPRGWKDRFQVPGKQATGVADRTPWTTTAALRMTGDSRSAWSQDYSRYALQDVAA